MSNYGHFLSSTLRKALGTTVREISLLPDTHQIAAYGDCVADLLVSQIESENVSSKEDLEKLISGYVSKNFKDLGEKESRKMKDAVYSSLRLYLGSLTEGVKDLLSVSKENEKIKSDTDSILSVGEKMGFVLRIPAYKKDSESQKALLSKILTFGITMLGFNADQVRLKRDHLLGEEIQLPKKIEEAMDKCMASISLEGNPLEAYTFRTGLKATLPETVAALKLLRENSIKITRSDPKKNPLSANELRENLSIRFALNAKQNSPFIVRYVKAILNEMTKPLSRRLPGKFIHSLKVQNAKSSKTGLLALMGYSAKAIPYNKVLFLLKDRVCEEVVEKPKSSNNKFDPKGQTRLVLKEYKAEKFPEGRTFREARLALVCGLPYIVPGSSKTTREQVSIDAMSMEASEAMKFFVKNRKLANAINLAYATKASLGKKGSKSTLRGYKNLLDRCMRLSSHVTLKDGSGIEYQSLLDIPDNIRNALYNSIGGYKPPKKEEKVAEQPTPKKDEPIKDEVQQTLRDDLGESTKEERSKNEALALMIQAQLEADNKEHIEVFGNSIGDCDECQRGQDYCTDCRQHNDPQADCGCGEGNPDSNLDQEDESANL